MIDRRKVTPVREPMEGCQQYGSKVTAGDFQVDRSSDEADECGDVNLTASTTHCPYQQQTRIVHSTMPVSPVTLLRWWYELCVSPRK